MSVDLDGGLLFHMLKGGSSSVEKALMFGVRAEMLKPKYRKAFEVVVEQSKEAGTVPGLDDIKGLFGGVVAPTGMELTWIVKYIHQRREFGTIAEMLEGIKIDMGNNDPVAAKEKVLAVAESLRLDPSQGVTLQTVFSLGEGVKKEYETNESGEIGIPTPWPTYNQMTMGLYPGTNTWFVARPGVGKTWILLIIILFAWVSAQEAASQVDGPGNEPLKILLISPEMLKVPMAERLFSLLAKAGYGAVVGGTLGEYGKKAFFDTIDQYQGHDGLFIMDATDGITAERIELAIEQCGATIVAIDSAYKIKWKERAKDRFENMYEGVDKISSWSKREWSDGRKVCFLAASQLNRDATKKGGMHAGAVALSDNIMWEADNLFMLEQDLDMKADQQLRLLTTKCRRMAKYTPSVLMKWNMSLMDFGEMEDPKKHAEKNAKFNENVTEDDF